MKTYSKILALIILISLFSCGKNQEIKDNNSAKSDNKLNKYLEQGQKISDIYFNTIRTHLIEKMSSNEISGAVEYCNENAYKLTDSLNKEFDVYVKRTSLKLRNPNNAPNEREIEILNHYEQLLANGEKLNDSVIKLSDTKYWYVKPIFAQGLCQNCHGNVGSTISEKNYEIIKKLYPKDEAINLKQGDLRGIWSIEMEEKPDK